MFLARLVCGRCGQYTNENSTYCPRDHWTLLADLPGLNALGGPAIEFETPPGTGGFLARRRQEGARDQLEKAYRANLERRLEALEKRQQAEPNNYEVLRAMGILAYLESHYERANALLERAHALAPDDFETTINYAITLGRRGQYQPAITLLNDARQKWPKNPVVYYNLALVALQARRPALVYEAVGILEDLWLENMAIAQEFHDGAVTARGLAFLQENKVREARAELDAAARHLVRDKGGEVIESLGEGADEIQVSYTAKEGEDYLLEGKIAEADSLNNLALAEAAMGEIDRALSRLKAALRLEPGHPQVLNNLGVLAYRQGRLNVALKYLDLARQVEDELEITEPTTYNHLAVVLSSLGRLDDALDLFQRASGSERAEFEVWYNLGRAFIEHGKPDRGVEYLRNAFNTEPNNPDVHTVLAAAYLFRGKVQLYAEALKHLKRALQIDAHHRTAAINLALALQAIRNTPAALNIIEQARKLFPDEAGVWFLLGLMALENPDGSDENHWATAAERFDRAANNRPDVTSALYDSALCQFLMGFRDTSAKLLEVCVQRDPSLGPAYYLIGFGHAVANRSVEAMNAWKIAAQYEPENGDLHANLGALLYRKGDYQAAIRSYMQAHRLLPQDAEILAALGVTFAQAKMYNQAVTALEQSLEINPRSPMAHSNLGLAYYLFKQVEKAMEHWRTVSRLDSSYAARREEEQTKSFDDSVVQLRNLNWEDRVVHMAPVLPRPHTRLLPGTNARTYKPAVSDPALQQIEAQKREVERASHLLAWMSVKV
jgi:tetratricopeptide (TPR) repeat protein